MLVRILVDDPGQPDQVSSARALAAEATEVHVPTIVLVETVWVLENSYKLHKRVWYSTSTTNALEISRVRY